MPEGRPSPEGPLAASGALVAAALSALEGSRARIDNLNVFPVPDGDTGTNMVMTARAAANALEGSRADTREAVARDLTRACLMGARGNSGVILSQLVRGAVEALADDRPVDLGAAARALRAAAEAGYAAVRDPQEGTILTVARALAERAEEIAGRPSRPELGHALAEILAHGEEALARTPEQLAVLREAGVVDAGGAGLVEILRGIAAHVRGEPLPVPAEEPEPLPLEAVHRELSRYRYCTSFFVEGDEADPEAFEREIAAYGDSILVVGSRGAVKVHFHTDDPGRAVSLATAVGVVEEVEIANMHVQTHEREERLRAVAGPSVSGVVAVSAGAGNARIFRSMGAAAIVEGGQSMNPSTSELLAAVEAAEASEVVLLPNNRNVILAAEQAAAEAAKPVVVVPTTTVQAGLCGMVEFDPSRSAAENARAMEEAAGRIRSGAVTRASRSAVIGGLAIEEGQFLGLVEGDPVAAGSALAPVARNVVERLLSSPCDVLTVLVGEGLTDLDGLLTELRAAHPGLEIEMHTGGQPHYPLLFAAE